MVFVFEFREGEGGLPRFVEFDVRLDAVDGIDMFFKGVDL